MVFMFESYCFLVCFVCFFGVMISQSITIDDSFSNLFKGTSIGVYTLGFGLVLFCIRGSSNSYMPGNNFFPPVCVISVLLHDQLANF